MATLILRKRRKNGLLSRDGQLIGERGLVGVSLIKPATLAGLDLGVAQITTDTPDKRFDTYLDTGEAHRILGRLALFCGYKLTKIEAKPEA